MKTEFEYQKAPDWTQHSMISVEKSNEIKYSTECDLENDAVQKIVDSVSVKKPKEEEALRGSQPRG